MTNSIKIGDEIAVQLPISGKMHKGKVSNIILREGTRGKSGESVMQVEAADFERCIFDVCGSDGSRWCYGKNLIHTTK